MPLKTVKVDRTTSWGNPFRVGKAADKVVAKRWGWALTIAESASCADVAETVERFRERLKADGRNQERVLLALSGKNLACWCKTGTPCHGDLLLLMANCED